MSNRNWAVESFMGETGDVLSKSPPAEGSGPTNAILARIPVGHVPSRGIGLGFENTSGRSWLSALVWILVMSLASVVMAEPLQLRPGTNIYAGSGVLNVGSYAIPCVADWNGDGKKDLLIGYQPDGMIQVYTNSGTDAQPTFKNFYNLQASGVNIQHASSGCGAPAPWVCDFNGDGKRDLLVGDGADGTIYFYRNTNTDAAPKLVLVRQLTAGGTILTVGSRATPYVCDWDGDGLQDLLVGDGSGYVTFYKNTNTNPNAGQLPIYAAGVKIQAGGTDLILGSGSTIRSVVRVFDWDGDGLKDLVCSSDSGVYWCRNTNSNSQPILQAKAALQAPSSTTGKLVNINTGGRMRLDLVDWNNDGVMDLILGNLNGTVSYYEGYHFRSRLIPQTNNTIVLQWDSAPFLKYNVLAYDCPDGIPCPAVTNLPSGGKTTTWTNQMQGGQQFFRVQIAP
jgi:hypothetical protein